MLHDREFALLETLKLNPGASHTLIDQAPRDIGGTLPSEYLEVIERANGGEGFVGGGGFLELWPIEEIAEVSAANEFEQSASGLVPFASDGGGNVFAFDRHSPATSIVELPLIGISRHDAETRANSIGELLTYLARQRREPLHASL